MLECAFAYPVALTLIMGLIVQGLGVYRYQHVAHLAREAARWAAVHGSSYQSDTKSAAPSKDDLLTKAIYPRMVGLSKASLSVTTFTMTNGVATVSLRYDWRPEAAFGSIALTSTAAEPIAY
jgi:hypothetical protein